MRLFILKILAKQVWVSTLKSKSVLGLIALMGILLAFSVQIGYKNLSYQQALRSQYQREVREKWENSPDKHPHRMAHYGYIAFREKYPLSFFDSGMESYTGNAVFLEAHRQNTVNFSEASLSTGILRLGEISAAMVLQVLLPLLIFFWGFNFVAADRENGTLKLLLTQGVSWSEIIVGKAFGLFSIAFLVFVVAIVASLPVLLNPEILKTADDPLSRFGILLAFYALYIFICCLLAVLVSALSATSKSALTQLIGFWLLFTIILPRTAQAFGQFLCPTPSKVAFETALEAELLKQGDSHNPNDVHYKALKDSILRVYKVDSVQQLPFNYSGFQMKEGERLSAKVYNEQQRKLLNIYEKQQNVTRLTAFINPFMAIKNLSMALTGTDFAAYTDFQNQAEAYRYRLAQRMNDLQIRLISNKKLGEKEKPYFIDKENWRQFPDFKYQFLTTKTVFKNESLSLFALLAWFIGLLVLVKMRVKRFKAV